MLKNTFSIAIGRQKIAEHCAIVKAATNFIATFYDGIHLCPSFKRPYYLHRSHFGSIMLRIIEQE